MSKVMFYINAIHDGGAERVMINLSEGLAKKGYEVVLVTSFRDKWEYRVDPIVVRYSLEKEQLKQSKLRRNLSRISKLRKLLKKEHPDVLISFMAEPNYRSIIASIGLPVKTIISVRNDPQMEYAGKIGYFLAKCLLPFADGCVFQTEDAKAWFSKTLQKKSVVISNPVKDSFYSTKRNPIHGLIVTLGRLEDQKNQMLLINSFAKVHERYPYTTLKIYGDGSLKDKLQERINELGLQNSTFLMGVTCDVEQVLSTAEAFVLSSLYEGMPNALMEALAMGIPSISTDCPCGGRSTVININLNGLLVPVEDENMMIDALNRLMGDSMLRTRLGKNAKISAGVFSSHRVENAWCLYLNRVITQKL